MAQVNIVEEKIDFLKLVNLLETRHEEVIYLEKSGVAVAQLTLIPKKAAGKRIGCSRGKFKVPDMI